MWLILQQDQPEDFVIATGRTHTIRRFVELSFEAVGLNYQDYVVQDLQFMRPADVDPLVGDPSKARRMLGWETETTFEDLVGIMVESELKANRPA
jgi:GDPmannose 4,6-dehydratase